MKYRRITNTFSNTQRYTKMQKNVKKSAGGKFDLHSLHFDFNSYSQTHPIKDLPISACFVWSVLSLTHAPIHIPLTSLVNIFITHSAPLVSLHILDCWYLFHTNILRNICQTKYVLFYSSTVGTRAVPRGCSTQFTFSVAQPLLFLLSILLNAYTCLDQGQCGAAHSYLSPVIFLKLLFILL